MYDKRELVAKGFISAGSARANMVQGIVFKPVPQCTADDYVKLPPEVRGKYQPTPKVIGNQKVHELRT